MPISNWISISPKWKHLALACSTLFLLLLSCLAAQAAPPVRIAVVTGNGSGVEQDIVDRISSQLSNMPDVALSTVNPDWYVVCNINESIDQMSGSIRYNGSVLVKTNSGQVIHTAAVQKYNQDFSVSGTPQLNKRLVDNAARDVINAASTRVIGPIQQAVMIEMETRDRIIQSQSLGDEDKYQEAISLLRPITPDTPHFKDVRALIDQFEMEQDALERMQAAQAKAQKGSLGEAINIASGVNAKSKRYKASRAKIAGWRAMLTKKKAK